MSREPDEILRDALAHFQTTQAYAEHDLDEQLVIDAVCMRLSAGIEVLAALDPDVRDQLFGTDWPLMWGIRNRIAHGYLLVDTAIVRQTLDQDIPKIIDRIRGRLGSP
ncbi:MAG: DUF86 domain-containing protein [Actinobacteria bacterium]|nr:DUF86 domain-containing protein [Actinomycetota bacterium]